MIILATADFHGSEQAFRKTAFKATQISVDLIVVCGDVTHFGSVQEAVNLLSILSYTPCPVLFVPGNCDPPNLADASPNIKGVKCIHRKCEHLMSVNFLGIGGSSPSPFNTPFELSEREMTHAMEQGYNSCERQGQIVLVSHDPPKGSRVDVTYGGEHVGSCSTRAFVERVKPKLVICGHIHEAVGVDSIGHTVVVNPGTAKHGQCSLINLNQRVEIQPSSL